MTRLRPTGASPGAADTPAAFAVEVVRDVRIPTAVAGETLAADLYLPVTGRPVPLLLTVLPYRKDFHAGVAHEVPGRWFAERGYAGLLVDLAGTGSSDGVRRPEFDPGDGTDAVAAIDWGAGQSWCDGSVGMWGHSYGAITTLRTAGLAPPQLRAVIPLMHGLDPGMDTVHPDGSRGDLHALANRGTSMLVQQLLPPLINHKSEAEQERWQRRLYRTEPVLLDFARHGPGDPVWRERAIDGAAITVPTLCIGGWRDAFPDPLVQAYERISGPKKLVMGPWGHVMPQYAAVAPVDFLSMALRWWDHWLRGRDTGVMDEPPVTLYQEGPRPHWRAHPCWPPSDGSLRLATADDTVLRPPNADPPSADRAVADHLSADDPTAEDPTPVRIIAEYRPDATVGSLRGIPGLGIGEAFLTQDQHDDDMRSVVLESEPLQSGTIIGGRPDVTVTLAQAPDAPAKRLVVRLTEVDSDGRSTLITVGVLCPRAPADRYRVELRPTVHQVPAGRRLRVTLSDSDFPRLTPLPDPVELHVSRLELTVPTLSPDAGVPTELPPPPRVPVPPDSGPPAELSWTITRDLIHDGIEVAVSAATGDTGTDQGHRYRSSNSLLASVRRDAPDSAVTMGTNHAAVTMSTGETVTTTAVVRCSLTALWASGEVTVDGVTVFTRTWESPLGW
ncbi:CocE/NonD family hydrolase, partial [Streptacidiphilus carbonis]|uniref:CocE/NonD family hydrolase n=1 Tax=Streptacidiphilus carbonis TaxID=105422 RepID=UPI0005A64FD3